MCPRYSTTQLTAIGDLASPTSAHVRRFGLHYRFAPGRRFPKVGSVERCLNNFATRQHQTDLDTVIHSVDRCLTHRDIRPHRDRFNACPTAAALNHRPRLVDCPTLAADGVIDWAAQSYGPTVEQMCRERRRTLHNRRGPASRMQEVAPTPSSSRHSEGIRVQRVTEVKRPMEANSDHCDRSW